MIKAWCFTDAYVLDRAARSSGFFSSPSSRNPPSSGFYYVNQHSQSKAKEDSWEQIRLEVAPHAPSRIGAFFAFADRDTCSQMLSRWNVPGNFIEEVEIRAGARFILVDAEWLEGARQDRPPPEPPRTRAAKYWLERKTDNPILEYVVNGDVYFPNWEKFSLI